MTKQVTRALAVNCLLWRFTQSWAYEFRPDGSLGLICPICKKFIDPEQSIQFDHVHAVGHGGPHEYQNIRPIHGQCHKKKSARDVALIAKVARLRRETKQGPKKKMPSRPWPKRGAL